MVAAAGKAADPAVPALVARAARHPLDAGEFALVMSGVHLLAAHSPLHAAYAPGRLAARVEPALRLGQFLCATDARGRPRAFAAWALLSQPVLDAVLDSGRDLAGDEFACGDLPMFCEFIAPFGGCAAMVRLLRAMPQFAGRRVPALRVTSGGGLRPRPRLASYAF